MIAKNCQACNKTIKGRTDKKFFDASCRNSFNNRLYNYSIPVVRNINRILRKNKQILDELMSDRENKVLIIEIKDMVEMGFQFEYFTELFHPDNKELYYYCHNYGYRPIDSENVMAVKITRKRRKAYFPYSPTTATQSACK